MSRRGRLSTLVVASAAALGSWGLGGVGMSGWASSGPGAGMAAAAAAEAMSLEYQARLLGLPLASASARVETAGGHYRVRGEFQSGGLASIFSPWRQEAISAGRLEPGGGLSAERHWQSGTYKGRPRHIDLSYAPQRATITSAKPDPDERDAEERVPPDITGGTTDVLSGLLGVARQVGDGRGCDATIPIFDGRRRYDVTISEPASSASGGADGAVECRFVVTQLAGFDVDKPGLATDPKRPGRIWFREAAPGGPTVPVRLELATGWGTAVVELVGMTQETEAAAVGGRGS